MAMPNEGWIRIFHRAESQKVSTQPLLDIGSINRPDFGLACSIVAYYGCKKSCGGVGQENGQGLNHYSPSSVCRPVCVCYASFLPSTGKPCDPIRVALVC